jgi:hypothetical protein
MRVAGKEISIFYGMPFRQKIELSFAQQHYSTSLAVAQDYYRDWHFTCFRVRIKGRLAGLSSYSSLGTDQCQCMGRFSAPGPTTIGDHKICKGRAENGTVGKRQGAAPSCKWKMH